MWNEKELMIQLEQYLTNTSKEQLVQDLLDNDCLKYFEDIRDETKKSDVLTTGELIRCLEVGDRAVVVADGYIGGIVYKYESAATGYTEIRWEESGNILSIGGFLFDTKWKLLPKEENEK